MAADKKRTLKLTLFNSSKHHLFLPIEINSIYKLKLKKKESLIGLYCGSFGGWHHTRQPHSVSDVSKKAKKYLLYFSPLLRRVVGEKSLTKPKVSLFPEPWDLFSFINKNSALPRGRPKEWQITNIFNWLFLPGHWRLEVCCHGSGQTVSLDICPCLCPGDCWIISTTTFSKPHCCHKPLVI